jgi:hypothetical protein
VSKRHKVWARPIPLGVDASPDPSTCPPPLPTPWAGHEMLPPPDLPGTTVPNPTSRRPGPLFPFSRCLHSGGCAGVSAGRHEGKRSVDPNSGAAGGPGIRVHQSATRGPSHKPTFGRRMASPQAHRHTHRSATRGPSHEPTAGRRMASPDTRLPTHRGAGTESSKGKSGPGWRRTRRRERTAASFQT